MYFGSYGMVCLDIELGDVIWLCCDFFCDYFCGLGLLLIFYNDLLIVYYDGVDY